ncbi:MAG: hypothetical protein IVW57_17160, partial [Ktedonobacterales bacterium]|nr:hypothetical protein [Ktedonobacterales bacterium]
MSALEDLLAIVATSSGLVSTVITVKQWQEMKAARIPVSVPAGAAPSTG